MKILIFFLALYLNSSLADSFTEDDRKYLSDLPTPTSENFRWLVPADAWRYKQKHLLKGKYFKISSIKELNVYDNPSFNNSPLYILKGSIYKGNKDLCEGIPYKRTKLTNFLDCMHAFCKELELTLPLEKSKNYRKYSLNEYSDAEYLLNVEKYSKCLVDMDYMSRLYIRDNSDEDSIYNYVTRSKQVTYRLNHYLKSVGIDKDKNYLEVLVNGVKHYVDIRACKKTPENCKEVDIKFSDYEKDWIKLKKHQEKKDLYGMNYLIANLRPCVEKRDVACIKKFFPDPVKDDYLTDWYIGYEMSEVKVDDELINELKACLDYKNVLPHLYASRGINKACIFHFRDSANKIDKSDIKLLNVTYPEAVRIEEGDSVFLFSER